MSGQRGTPKRSSSWPYPTSKGLTKRLRSSSTPILSTSSRRCLEPNSSSERLSIAHRCFSIKLSKVKCIKVPTVSSSFHRFQNEISQGVTTGHPHPEDKLGPRQKRHSVLWSSGKSAPWDMERNKVLLRQQYGPHKSWVKTSPGFGKSSEKQWVLPLFYTQHLITFIQGQNTQSHSTQGSFNA